MPKLTHFDDAGSPRMVNVSDKSITGRTARAQAFVKIRPEVLDRLHQNPKGNPLDIARVAGIMAAKKTAELIPLCHPLLLSHADVDIAVEAEGVRIVASASTAGPTGVEMEALTAATVAALTVYDMTKALDKRIEISEVYLLEKTGGEEWRLPAVIRVAILTVSDSVAGGTREDVSGAKLRERVQALGWQVSSAAAVADEREQIAAKLAGWAGSGECQLILTTGGTGIALRDVTPEATRDVIEREIPGIGEQMRAEGRKMTPTAGLSRAIAGTRGRVLIINLPGSPKGAVESFDVIAKLAPHMVDLIEGRTEHSNVPH